MDLSKSKHALLISAERHFGAVGISGASLRTISENAGYKNVYAAQYHFKDKDGLIKAIFQMRRPEFDVKREEYFRHRGINAACASLPQLIESIYSPIFYQKDVNNIRTYARFVQFLVRYDKFETIFPAVANTAPVTEIIMNALRNHVPIMNDELWLTRRRILARFALDAIADFDRKSIKTKLNDVEYFDEILRLLVQSFKCEAIQYIS